MTRGRMLALWAPSLALVLVLSGCGVLEDTLEGVTGRGPDTPNATQAPESLSVRVEIESDATASGELEISINSANDSQSVKESSVELPYSKDFEVPTDAPFPFRGSHVEVAAGPDASWVECRIIMDEKVVASHRSEGTGARAVCDRSLRLGPS